MHWTRRRFVAAASAGSVLGSRPALAAWAWPRAQEALPPPRSQASSPEITAGGVVPLLESNVARPLRYTPEVGAFNIRNGSEFFNRPLYGPNIPFRVDGGDRPEFSLYLPGHGGNLRLGIAGTQSAGAKWLFECAFVVSRYVDGRLRYQVRDPLLGPTGMLQIEAMTFGAGLGVELTAHGVADGLQLVWAFGGVSGRKGQRNGDIGCEKEPVAQFFQMRPEECAGNVWTLGDHDAEVASGKIRLRLQAPGGAVLRVGSAARWNRGWQTLWASADPHDAQPVLLGAVPLTAVPLHLSVEVLEGAVLPAAAAGQPGRLAVNAEACAQRRAALSLLAGRVKWHTPDPFLDSMAPALNIAADAIWDEAQGCVMHGAVAWRMALAGWRGPYALDTLARHDRMQRHLRRWIARQDTSAVTNGSGGVATASGFAGIVEANGSPDPGSHGARTENLLHSAGDLSHNHYDMNLVFFDALLRHLRWTGDLAFAREAWPALLRHAAWERRLFRRDYDDGGDNTLPLYEAYAAIWASDNLQYNGGGAAHSSAYNVFLNRGMAELARLLGEPSNVAAAFEAEAEAISRAMRALLWMPAAGAFAESREWLGERQLAVSPAVWTVYHTIDSEVTTPTEAWQMAAERLRALRKVPIVGEGVPSDAGWQLPCSDWQSYVWSLTLLTLGENLAMALALFQAGMADEGYALLRGSLLDAGYRGLCPGNFPMSLQLDPHRQESQRDFGDPIGCASRAIVEGLWGVQPDLLHGKLALRPQLPLAWIRATFEHPELHIELIRDGATERWFIAPKFSRPVEATLALRASTTERPQVRLNGSAAAADFLPSAVGEPRLTVALPARHAPWRVEVTWTGAPPVQRPSTPLRTRVGEPLPWPAGVQHDVLDDPQGCLRDGMATQAGGHTVFALQRHPDCRYWLPLELRIDVPNPASAQPRRGVCEPVALGDLLTSHARDIFARGYTAPRPGLCSLNLPDGLLGGWANFDVHAAVDDAGLRGAGGLLRLPDGVAFATPQGNAPNCCFLSQWAQDKPGTTLPLHGRARAVHLLLVGTTFPQATWSRHATLRAAYADGTAADVVELRSPDTWWPVEQDYLRDDFVFRLHKLDSSEPPPVWRVDLRTGAARQAGASAPGDKHTAVPGGSAFACSVRLDPRKELASITLHCELYGIVLGLLAVSLERP